MADTTEGTGTVNQTAENQTGTGTTDTGKTQGPDKTAERKPAGEVETGDTTAGALFSDEVVTEAMLKGEAPEDKGAGATTDTDKGKADTAGKSEDQDKDKKAADAQAIDTSDKKAGDKAGDDKKAEDATDKDTKPPAGFVPIGALHEARTKLKTYYEKTADLEARLNNSQAEIDSLKQRLTGVKGGDADKDDEFCDEDGNFIELTGAEFKLLREKSPEKAVDYLDARQRNKERIEADNQRSSRVKAIIDDAHSIVHDEVPEIFEDPEFGKNLSAFLTEQGMPNKFIPALSSPETMIIPPGKGSKPIPLGPAAAGFVIMASRVFKAMKANDPTALRGQIEKELREKITAEERANIFKKIKDEGVDKGGFQSLESLATSGDTEMKGSMLPFTEEDYEKMSPEERKRRLGG